jgi:H(+)-translocating pyrophosphatase
LPQPCCCLILPICPPLLADVPIPQSFIGIALVRNFPLDNEKTTLATLLRLINWGVYLASFLSIGTTICACVILFDSPLSWRLVGATLIGLVAGIVIANFTEYCTSYEDAPTRGISSASEFGPAPVIIKGLGVGMMSVSVPVIAIVITILACNALVGLYGVSIAAVGMLCTLPITLATDAYGPVADNAGGLAEMAGMPPEIRSRTDRLDSLGNTTAATGKGLAIGSALLTAIGLISAFLVQSGAHDVQLNNAITLAGILIGCGLPFVFGALTMLSVDRGARSIIVEVRRQFATCPDLLELPAERAYEQVKGLDGKMYPDANRCVQIATEAAIQEMVLPGILAVFVPVGVGYLLGPFGLGGLLAGSLGTCFCLALTVSRRCCCVRRALMVLHAVRAGSLALDLLAQPHTHTHTHTRSVSLRLSPCRWPTRAVPGTTPRSGARSAPPRASPPAPATRCTTPSSASSPPACLTPPSPPARTSPPPTSGAPSCARASLPPSPRRRWSPCASPWRSCTTRATPAP